MVYSNTINKTTFTFSISQHESIRFSAARQLLLIKTKTLRCFTMLFRQSIFHLTQGRAKSIVNLTIPFSAPPFCTAANLETYLWTNFSIFSGKMSPVLTYESCFLALSLSACNCAVSKNLTLLSTVWMYSINMNTRLTTETENMSMRTASLGNKLW